MINPMSLDGKIVLITGASSGIGRETAVQISRLGGTAILVARNERGLRTTLSLMEGDSHVTASFDLADVCRIESWLESVVVKYGRLNGLVHCAGVAPMRPLAMTKPDVLHDTMEINFSVFVELLRVFSKKKNNLDGGSIVGMSSVRGVAGEKSLLAYSASKAAMDAAVRVAAHELAPKHIRVNTVQAGLLDTRLAADLDVATAPDGEQPNVLSRQLLGLGHPLDAANAICYLLSDASSFITGSALVVDGGYLA